MSLKRRPPPGNIRRVAAIDGNLRGVMTNKTGRVVQFESFAERSLLLRLDRDPTVRDYSSQPETFQRVDTEGRPQRYTPDFIVWRGDGATEIHEVEQEGANFVRTERVGRSSEVPGKNCDAQDVHVSGIGCEVAQAQVGLHLLS